jgi:eukaryotic-like serine/threonine-protein kinase
MPAPLPSIGQVLGHYRIIEQIGAGGMGVVYRAHDEQLDRDVAIKVLPSGVLAEGPARKRFRKEALSLAKVNHPNIATIFEFGTQNGVDFLVTEYVPGTTLDERLSAGALPINEVIDLGAQLAEGLSAAHECGIIHRDLKPGNLRLTPGGRLKILDFGLAQLIPQPSELEITATLTESQEITGTLPYMAPEQLRGEIRDARSDLWAAGAVLYELATNKRPFPEMRSPMLINAILNTQPQPPSKLNPLASSDLEKVIYKALTKDPTHRYQTARELGADLKRLTADGARLAIDHRILSWLLTIAGPALLVVFLALSWYFLQRGKHSGSAESSIKARHSVAVLGFKNLSAKPEQAWLSTALSEMLTTELAAGEKLRTIPGEDIARTKADLSLPDADSLGKETLMRLRKNLSTDFVVLGSYLDVGKESGGQIRLDLHLQDAVAGETVATLSETGTEGQLLDLVSRTGVQLREKLGVGQITPTEATGVKASIPSNTQVTRLYSEGVTRLRMGDALGARDLLDKAAALEPKFALAHSALAQALSLLGYDSMARAEAKRAFEMSANLSREDHLWIEGRYREIDREADKAVEIYRTLWGFFPDNLEYGLRLAGAQTDAGKAREALASVDAMRQRATALDPRIDQAEANAAAGLGDFKRQQSAAATAAEKARQQGARFLQARALYSEGWAFLNLGQLTQAMKVAQESEQVSRSLGDRTGVGRVLYLAGSVRLNQGDLSGAIENFEQALSGARETGSKMGMSTAMNNIANTLLVRGDLVGAREMFEQARTIFHEIGDKDYEGYALTNVAAVLVEQGEWATAKNTSEQALKLFRELNDKDGLAFALTGIGSALDTHGDLAGAEQQYRDALDFAQEVSDKSISAYALYGLSNVLAMKGDLVAAKNRCLESVDIRNEIGEKANVAESRSRLAELLIEERNPKQSEASVRQALQQFRAEKLKDDEIRGQAILAAALLAQGRKAEAKVEIDQVEDLVSESQNVGARLKFLTVAGSVRAQSGNHVEARHLFENALATASRLHLLGDQLQARLMLGELEMKMDSTAGHIHLEAVEKDARAGNFLLIARKAAAAAKGTE